MTNAATVTVHPAEATARAEKAWRIASSVIKSAGADLALMESCALLIASATDVGTRFTESLWAQIGESNPRSMSTRAAVATRIEQHVALVRRLHAMPEVQR